MREVDDTPQGALEPVIAGRRSRNSVTLGGLHMNKLLLTTALLLAMGAMPAKAVTITLCGLRLSVCWFWNEFQRLVAVRNGPALLLLDAGRF